MISKAQKLGEIIHAEGQKQTNILTERWTFYSFERKVCKNMCKTIVLPVVCIDVKLGLLDQSKNIDKIFRTRS
jgi:hypothetical protein